MGRIVQFDLDDLLAKVEEFSSNAPSLIAQAESLGFAIPGSAAKYLGLAGIAAQGFKKIVPKMGSGLEFEGLPNTGPLGRGRFNYIKSKHKFSDADVVAVLNAIVTNAPQVKTKEIDSTISLTMSLMNPGSVDEKSNEQVRKAIDHILENEKLDAPMWDKFGDIIYYGLTTIERK